MSIIKLLENEIRMERRILKNYGEAKFSSDVLICRQMRGKPRFFIRNKNEKREVYTSVSKSNKLELLYKDHLNSETAAVLRNNITVLEKALQKIDDYDAESVSERLPGAYGFLKEALKEKATKDMKKGDNSKLAKMTFPQSENTKDRIGLKYRTSFGLMVRYKNEMLIAEALYAAGVNFRYEKALELVMISANGLSNTYNTVILYPDFTIYLPDGDVIYWEHLGMWEQKDYRDDNVARLSLYFVNGIYPPKSLILTVDGKEMPFDNNATWRLIEGMILSKY